MFAAPLLPFPGWIGSRHALAPQTLDKHKTHVLLQASLALKNVALLEVGNNGRTCALSSTELLAQLRLLRTEACAEVWRLALEAEYPHVPSRNLFEEFRHPHPLVMGLLAAWAVDGLGKRPTLRDRFAQARLEPGMGKEERIARLWAVRVLAGRSNKPLDAAHLAAAAAQLSGAVRAVLHDLHGGMRSECVERLREALKRIAQQAPTWRPEPADASELFAPTPAPVRPGRARMSLDRSYRHSADGLRGPIYGGAFVHQPRQPSPRLPRPTVEALLERMHACRNAVAPVWARLPPPSSLPLEAWRNAAVQAFAAAPSPREWGEGRWLGERRSSDELSHGTWLPWVHNLNFAPRFGSTSGSLATSNTFLSDSDASIADDWQLIAGIDE